MASKATPVYGKQYIRFAETAYVCCDTEIPQFRLVTVDPTGGPCGDGTPTDPPTAALMVAGGNAWGVMQQYFNTCECDYATDRLRLGTVATSGLLLIEADGDNLQAQGDALLVDAEGRSSSAGAAVSVDNTYPTVRQQVLVGGVSMVLVSFN
jgi:hypothetical protein